MTPATRRSVFGLGTAGLAIIAASDPIRAQPIVSDLAGFRMGTVGWKQYHSTKDDFTYYPGMYPREWFIKPGNIFVCSPFAHGQTFVKRYDDTVLRVNLFGDLTPGDENSCFTGLFLTMPGTIKPENWASIAINGQRGQDMTYCIHDDALAGTFPAGEYGTQVYVGLYPGSKPCTWKFAGATTMKIFEDRLPERQR